MARDGLLIGEVSTRSGLSRKALRLYEARGILPPSRRTPSGYRTYPLEVVGVLHFITQARRLGLTLAVIGSIVALRCSKPGPCVHVRTLLERKVADLDNLRRELRHILDSWDASSRRRGVVCQRIEANGGDTTWRESRSAQPARPAPRSSWKATPSVSAKTRTLSSSRKRNERASRCHQIRPARPRVIGVEASGQIPDASLFTGPKQLVHQSASGPLPPARRSSRW